MTQYDNAKIWYPEEEIFQNDDDEYVERAGGGARCSWQIEKLKWRLREFEY